MKKQQKKRKPEPVNPQHYLVLAILVLVLLVIVGLILLFKKNNKSISIPQLIKAEKPLIEELWQQSDTGLIWTRCSIGQRWQNQSCTGTAKSYTWQDAQQVVVLLNQQNYLGYNDWRLPHIDELYRIVYCSSGFEHMTLIPDLADKNQQIKVGCIGQDYQRPTIDSKIFPQAVSGWYWSGTAYRAAGGFGKTAWGAYLSSGFVYDLSQDNLGYLFLVRDVNGGVPQ